MAFDGGAFRFLDGMDGVLKRGLYGDGERVNE